MASEKLQIEQTASNTTNSARKAQAHMQGPPIHDSALGNLLVWISRHTEERRHMFNTLTSLTDKKPPDVARDKTRRPVLSTFSRFSLTQLRCIGNAKR
ncbi:unnamed protein product [Fusarium graminearum]|uniref:Chromosome 3, complete genome n=2 Tax=Gibberella zeae TaxID=5518 RepID=A0A0E0SHG2_GIBZE|nr:hypothetical protein FG05_30374 [Fusarium graminearum]CAF3464825.1 unnamed protein product [Fusarium graminearum]CAF3587062.1 unnamed protein product [Fusarium graminearum]CAG1964032.1 unnamed protein product [Fusarium graminearum]CAG1985472.1 unnamed protein product [Fusarium graminearum]